MNNNLISPLTSEQIQKLSELTAQLSTEQAYWVSGYFAGLLAKQPAASVQTNISTAPAATVEAVAEASQQAKVLTILYGSRTGNGESLAKLAQKMASESGFEVALKNMENYKTRELKDEKNLLVIVSTHGDGEPPFQAKEFYEFLHSKRAPQLKELNFAVIGLGDRSYLKFCQVGVDIDKRLNELGAKRLNDRTDCDVDFRMDGMKAVSKLLSSLEAASGSVTATSVKVTQSAPVAEEHEAHNKLNPFRATVLDKAFLHGRDSDRQTLHVELSLEGSGLTYEPGDAMGVYATNPPELVEHVLETLQFSPDEKVKTDRGETTLSEALYNEFELTTLTPDVLNRFATATDNAELKNILADPSELKQFVHGKDIVDLLTHYPEKFNSEQFLSLLRKIQPRLYSISSSPLAHPDEAHLTVGVVKYNSKGRNKTGLCSVFLSDRVESDENAPIFIEKNPNFRLPDDPQTPIIMVGAGTGIAPYRSFVEHRAEQDNAGKSWLFFGNRYSESEFLYQLEWQRFLKEKSLTKMSVAFSRDSDKKVYVQDRLLENSREVFDWLENGGHFYICGDMKKMAGDVNSALLRIIENEGGLKQDQALEYINDLQRTKRYQTDVY